MKLHNVKTSGGALRRHLGRHLMMLALAMGGISAGRALAEESDVPIGMTVESVLDAAHSLSPTLRAAALDTAAASARTDRADTLAEPPQQFDAGGDTQWTSRRRHDPDEISIGRTLLPDHGQAQIPSAGVTEETREFPTDPRPEN
jgi:hypothetical protein